MTNISYVIGITGKKGTIKANTLARAQEVKSVLSESYRGVYIKTVYTKAPEVCTSVMSEKRREMFRKKYLES